MLHFYLHVNRVPQKKKMLIEYRVMGCIVFQMLMSAKIQTLAPKNAIISLGVSIAIVQKGTKAMG